MLPFEPFNISHLPQIVFGAGKINELAQLVQRYGNRALFVFGKQSFQNTPQWPKLRESLREVGIVLTSVRIHGEPSPQMIDDIVAEHREQYFNVVVGIGGGSVLDAAKAVAGLLIPGNSVMDHLEGVGNEIPYQGPSVPFIAVPTTAGTGSEATKNAVLSERRHDGFKKSFRDDQLVARIAVIDPELLAACPYELMAANGMDAFTQLLESYVSTRTNPMTDALALSGLIAFRDGFWDALENSQKQAAKAGRSRLAYASLLSGICLAQTGLGSVHGMASPLGAYFPIPHGVVCGTLVAEATEMNIRAMREREADNIALHKYAQVGALLMDVSLSDEDLALDTLVSLLRDWTQRLSLPRLGQYGMTETDLARVAAGSRGSSMKTNPLVLKDEELIEVLRRRL